MDNKFISEFTQLMINKLENLEKNWERPWIDTERFGIAQNIQGRKYNGVNSLMLELVREEKNFELPYFITFNQAKTIGITINKGEKSTPVIYWDCIMKNKETGEKINADDYKKLSEEEKKKYSKNFYTKHYNVFNIDQTNYKEIKPQLWKELKEKITIKKERDEKNMFLSKPLDNMVKWQNWYTPIYSRPQNKAYYQIKIGGKGEIILPTKEQFKTGEAYYSTMLHEMAHSTGHFNLLRRNMSGKTGSYEYGKEELIAELTAAVSGKELGIGKNIREENATYIKNWLINIKKDEKFLLTILPEINKASNMILDKIKIENEYIQKKEENKEKIVSNVNIYEQRQGVWAIRCKIEGEQQLAKTMTKYDLLAYFNEDLDKEKLANKYFSEEIKERNNIEFQIKR